MEQIYADMYLDHFDWITRPKNSGWWERNQKDGAKLENKGQDKCDMGPNYDITRSYFSRDQINLFLDQVEHKAQSNVHQ